MVIVSRDEVTCVSATEAVEVDGIEEHSHRAGERAARNSRPWHRKYSMKGVLGSIQQKESAGMSGIGLRRRKVKDQWNRDMP